MNSSLNKPAPLLGLAAVLVASMVSCTMKQNLDDMHGATMEMNQQTKDMNQQTKDLGEATVRMEGNMGEMYDALRQGDTLNARRGSWKALVEAQNATHKISEAGKYFMAFEYQLWSGVGEDTPETREAVAASAAREFLRDVHEYLEVGVEPLSEENDARVLNSLAVTMHLLNHKQEMMLKKHPDLKAISMYGMIEEALLAKKEMDEGKKTSTELPEYVVAILDYEEEAKILLQVRYNYLGAMALARVSKIREGALAYLGMRYWSGFTAELAGKNVVQIREVSKYLKGALSTRDLISAVGVEPRLDKNLRLIFDGMKLDAKAIGSLRAAAGSSGKANEMDQAIAELVKLVGQYKGSPVKFDDRIQTDSQKDSGTADVSVEEKE